GFHSCVRCHTRADVERATVTNRNRSNDDLPVFKVNEAQRCITLDAHVVANFQQVPTAVSEYHAAADVNTSPNLRPKRSQNHAGEYGAIEEPPRNEPNGLLHDPVPGVEASPDRCARGLIAANQNLLH